MNEVVEDIKTALEEWSGWKPGESLLESVRKMTKENKEMTEKVSDLKETVQLLENRIDYLEDLFSKLHQLVVDRKTEIYIDCD